MDSNLELNRVTPKTSIVLTFIVTLFQIKITLMLAIKKHIDINTKIM